jgi:hypothetical protein
MQDNSTSNNISKELKEMLLQGKFNLKDIATITPNQIFELYQEQYSELAGKPIARREAARKYNISPSCIADWERGGLVKKLVLGKKGSNVQQVIVDERDVAVMVAMRETYRTGKSGPIRGWKPPIAS